MNHYKSWSGLNRQLSGRLCARLSKRVTYFLARYHKVHNSYGRAAIRLDGRELVCFSWTEMYQQDCDVIRQWEETGIWEYKSQKLKSEWDLHMTYHDMDFLDAALLFLQMPIGEALESDNSIVRIFAIMDRRVGKRKLKEIFCDGGYLSCPGWVRQFYELRLECDGIAPHGGN